MEKTIICEFCSAECSNQDIYCPKCLKRIPEELHDPEHMIDNMGEHKVFVFVEKNADHYIEAFKRGNNKKIFPSFNWASFFFGSSWMVYRKMYVEAIVAYILCNIFSFFCALVILLPYKSELTLILSSASYQEAMQMLNAIRTDVLLQALLLGLIPKVFFGVFGDAIYKNYVKRNIHDLNKGGTLIWPLFIAPFVVSAIDLIFEPIFKGILSIFL